MKPKLSLGFIIVFVSFALLLSAGEESPKTVIEIRNAMTRLETHFLNLLELAQLVEPNRKTIRNEVLNFENASKRIRRINISEGLSKDLGKLESEIRKLKREAWRDDLTPFRKRLDGLYETCFKCHATHALPR